MCGRASLSKNEKELEKRFEATFYSEDLQQLPFPNYNIAPSHLHPIITNENTDHFRICKWGLIPFWAKTPAIGNKMINARIETILEKPAFKNAAQKRRCLVPFDGFYEWKKVGSNKIPYRIHLKNDELFAVAGLWERWQDTNGKTIYSFTVITQPPNELLSNIHDRMPAILLPEHEKDWLDTNLPTADAIQLIHPYPNDQLHAYTVSRRIGKVTENDPELLLEEKYEEGEQGTLF